MKDEARQPRQLNTPPEDLRVRTKKYGLRIVRLYVALPKRGEGEVLGKQLLRSGTSVGAHYREAHRAKSGPDFVSKMQGALQELDETAYWLELLEESGIVAAAKLKALRSETDELLAIFVSIVKKVKSR
jgi:four helix bundle protein